MAVKKHELVPENNVPTDVLDRLAYFFNLSTTYMSPTEFAQWCKTIVHLLSKLPIPKEPADQVTFYMQIRQIEEYLKKIVIETEPCSARANMLLCLLKQAYLFISTATPSTSPAVSIVLSLLDSPIKNVAVHIFVKKEEGNPCSTLAVEKALTTLCQWLCYWEGTQSLHQWIISFMTTLQESNKFEILFNVSNAVINDMFSSLQNPSVRSVVIHVFLHILSSTRDTIETFDKIAEQVPTVLESLASDTSPESRSVLQNLVEAFTALLDIHPADKEKYIEIVNCLDSHIKSKGSIMDVPIWERAGAVETMERRKTKVGLLNLGNSCYMNSAMQALFMTKQFSNAIVMSNLKFPLLCKLKTLFAHMMYSELPYLNPKDMFFFSKPDTFPRGTQQDTSEFICHLLDRLHEYECSMLSLKANSSDSLKSSMGSYEIIDDMCKKDEEQMESSSDASLGNCSTSPDSTTVSSSSMKNDDPIKRKHRSSFENALDIKRRCVRNDEASSSAGPTHVTIVEKVFAGLMKTSTRCSKCNFISSKKDAFWDLQLAYPEIQEGENYSVTQLLEHYCSPEKLVGDNQYRCQNCQSLQDAERSVSIEGAPKNLIVVLKQFFYDPKRRLRAKLFHKVQLNKYITILEKNVQKSYELYAVIVHSGVNLDNGHYYTIAKDTPTNKWYIFNDSDVQQCTEESVYGLSECNTPYIVFYKKLDMIITDEASAKISDVPEDKNNANDKSESASSNDESSSDILFNPNEETIPFSFLPAYLVEQVKSASMMTQSHKRIQVVKRRGLVQPKCAPTSTSRYSSSDDD